MAVIPTPLRDAGDHRILRELPGAATECRPEREVRHERDLSLDAQLEHVLAGPVDDAVGVLHLGDVDQVERAPCDGVGCGLADADQVELALTSQILERAELLGQQIAVGSALISRRLTRSIRSTAQGAQVVLDPGAQLGRALGGQPCALRRRGGRRPS